MKEILHDLNEKRRDMSAFELCESCWQTGCYTDNNICDFCQHRHECSGYEDDDDDDDGEPDDSFPLSDC